MKSFHLKTYSPYYDVVYVLPTEAVELDVEYPTPAVALPVANSSTSAVTFVATVSISITCCLTGITSLESGLMVTSIVLLVLVVDVILSEVNTTTPVV